MATYLQNKSSFDVSVDSTSSDSLSFAGLLSIQDLQSNIPPSNTTNQTKKQGPDLELNGTKQTSAAQSMNKNPTADMSISSGQLQLQAFLYSSQQTNMTNKPVPEDETCSNNKRLTDDNTDGTKISQRTTHKERNQAKTRNAGSDSSFGQKIFHTFFSPCRECHAQEPAVRDAHRARKISQVSS
ncbi:hypothetical protein Tsubulata_046932 [Turnera subulata]|uniref:Uncharacterized protein n=1 Tax=Turnera subulata TaxID=218843 RepID=A0A9Q0JCF8_9ROSI|nr:hypothetical protein Tsubulata_046932 [Turnera subulata]